MKLRRTSRIIRTLALAALLLGTGHASLAQEFPSRPLKFIVSISSGTGGDVVSRLLAERLTRAWGQPVVVENRAAASGFLALDAVKRAEPDGYTFVLVTSCHMSINPHLYRKLPYDPVRDFEPVTIVYRAPFVIAVSASGPNGSVRDLIAAAKARPGAASYGTPGVGSPAHLGSAYFEMLTGTKMIHVPFKEQTQLFGSVAAGDVTWALGTVGTVLPLVKAGKLKLIGMASAARLGSLPDVPTVQESGGPAGYTVDAWTGLFVPRGTPAGVVARISQEVGTAMRQPEMVQRLAAMGYEPDPGTPAQLRDIVKSDLEKYAGIVKLSGASVD